MRKSGKLRASDPKSGPPVAPGKKGKKAPKKTKSEHPVKDKKGGY